MSDSCLDVGACPAILNGSLAFCANNADEVAKVVHKMAAAVRRFLTILLGLFGIEDSKKIDVYLMEASLTVLK